MSVLKTSIKFNGIIFLNNNQRKPTPMKSNSDLPSHNINFDQLPSRRTNVQCDACVAGDASSTILETLIIP